MVYKAEDQRLGRVVALKVIREYRSTDTSRQQRFWQEARAAAQVAHPNACRLYDIAENDDQLVLVMEFIEGDSLALRLLQGAMPPREAAQIILSLLSALEAFHKLGIVHRDLKPGNILLSAAGTKLLDFGIAKQMPLTPLPETAATVLDTTMPGSFLPARPNMPRPNNFADCRSTRALIFFPSALFFSKCSPDTVLSQANRLATLRTPFCTALRLLSAARPRFPPWVASCTAPWRETRRNATRPQSPCPRTFAPLS